MPPESKKKQQLLTVDLQDLKPLVLEAAHCATQRPSSWVREVLAKALDVTAPRPAAAPAANLTKTNAPKLTLRLTRKDHERLVS